tara:strand:+ start:48 stop:437 length:390 start_codon:yes stop_codon:yes gene_type:complete
MGNTSQQKLPNLKTTYNLYHHITHATIDLNNCVKRGVMFKKAQKRTNYWSAIRKKAPKVPDITCPDIDWVVNQLEKAIGKSITLTQFKRIERKMEKLRVTNEQLRESGVYWHDACKETVRDLLGKKKIR